MNIFVLGNTPDESARCAVDAHLNKQVLECFQLLATRFPGSLEKKDGTLYGSAHEHHPLNLWLHFSPSHPAYTLRMAIAFANEHKRRFGTCLKNSYPWQTAYGLVTKRASIDDAPVTYPFYVPEYIRQKLLGKTYPLGNTPRIAESVDVAVTGYRLYYVLEKNRSMEKFQWTCAMPDWYADMCAKIGKLPF